MKKTGKLLSIMIIAVLVVIMIVSNNTNAQGIVELSTTNSSVNVGDTFSINLAGEGMKSIDLNLIYDSSIFEYVGVNNSSITANPGENSLAVYYSGDGVDSVGLKFKAIKSTEGKSSSIAISKDSCKIKLPVADTEGAEKVDTELGYENLKGLEAVLETNVTVNKITPTYEEPALDKTSVNIVKGKQDTVTITNADKIGKYSWSSDNEEIASVNDGVITGNSVGETNVVLTSEGGNKTIAVKVTDSGEQPTPEPDNERPVLTPAESLKIKKGDKSTIKSDKAVEWTSGNENSVKIVSSDENSVNIEGIAVGKSIITATSKQNNELQNTIIVEVVDENSNDNNNNNNNNNNGNQQGDNNQNNNNGNNNQGNNQNNGSNQNGNGSQTNNGSQNGNGNSGNRSNVQYSNTTTGGTQTRNSSSSANEVVPATGESSVETVAILVIATLIVASIVFRKRSKIK